MHPKYTGITVVDGGLGSGKTYYATRRIEWALRSSRPVVTNVELAPDWADRIARRCVLTGADRAARRAARADDLTRYYHCSNDVLDLLYRELDEPKENGGLMVIDEAHAELNSRLFNDNGRKDLVDRIRQLRKIGWEVVFISQSLESIDKQVRDALTYRIHLVNWRRRYAWFPFDLFLAVHFFAADKMTGRSATKPFAREVYRRDDYVSGLYDTMQLLGVHGSRSRPSRDELLPFPPRARAQLASTGAGEGSAAS